MNSRPLPINLMKRAMLQPGTQLIVALVLIGAAPATAAEPGPHSLIVARWVSDRLVDVPPCPEPAICAGGIYDVRLVDVGTLSGPAVPMRLTVRLTTVRTRPPGSDYQAILIVRPDDGDSGWAAHLLQSAVPGRDACIRSDWFKVLHLARPRLAYRRGGQTCFPAA